ncbi:MAG: peroxiredoxin family protein [Chitinophagaceae bacterium]|nr:MAG: peroxiredoxin family protein [Chitinophagaceae bacterium]
MSRKIINRPACFLLPFILNIVFVMSSAAQSAALRTVNPGSQPSYVIPQKPEDISPLLIGEKIPVVSLPDAAGNNYDLNKAVSEKPTILIFYRGGWCPFCSRQLAGLQDITPQLQKSGYQLIAISTDEPAGLSQSTNKEKLSYTLLSDADLNVSKKFGLAFKAPKNYNDLLAKSGGGKNVDLLLPVPSIFILDRKGVIQFEYINPDFKQRISAELLLAVAQTLKGNL